MNKETVFLEALLYTMEGKNPSKAIENQEKRGQAEVVRSHRLPIKTNGGIPNEHRFKGITNDMDYDERVRIANDNNINFTKQQYERMGIKVIDTYDDLFYTVELPEGWKIEATSHSMWNNLFDDRGRKRATFFYKAAFYDRDAFINFEHRYSYTISPFDDYETDAAYEERKFKPWTLFLTDNGEKIKELKEITATTDKEYLKIDDTLMKIGKAYLNENYPEWEDINSYWN